MSKSALYLGYFNRHPQFYVGKKSEKHQMTKLKIILLPTIRIRGNYGISAILAEEERSLKLLNFSEIVNKPISFHNKESS